MLTIWSLIPIYARRFHRLSVAAFAVCLGALWIVLFYRYTRLYIEANAPDLITGALDA